MSLFRDSVFVMVALTTRLQSQVVGLQSRLRRHDKSYALYIRNPIIILRMRTVAFVMKSKMNRLY